MLDWVIQKWEKNKGRLEAAIRQDKNINECEYVYLVELVVHYILNDGCEIKEDDWYEDELRWNAKRITEVDDGEWHGAKLFIIPKLTHWPAVEEYLFTYQYYGSCSVCDTLQRIQSVFWEKVVDFHFTAELPTESQVKDYLLLCQYLVCNMNWLGGSEEDRKMFLGYR